MKDYFKIDVPFVRQKTDFYCGPASLEMVFGYFNCEKLQDELAVKMNTKKNIGTKKNKMIEAVKENGFHYFTKKNGSIEELVDLVSKNIPVIVNFIEPSDEVSHYAVVVGFFNDEIVLSDPWNGNDFKIKTDEFINRWYGHEDTKKRWLLAVNSEFFSNCLCSKK